LEPLAIECKWSASDFDPTNIKSFRRQHPRGDNLVVAADAEKAFTRTCDDVRAGFVGLKELIGTLVP